MKLKNTVSRKKYVPFAGAIIEIPVSAEYLGVNRYGSVYAFDYQPFVTDLGDLSSGGCVPAEHCPDVYLVAHVEDFGDKAFIVSVDDLMGTFGRDETGSAKSASNGVIVRKLLESME